MNYLKITPKGIDIPIAYLQTTLYSKLTTVWNVEDATLFNMYGRAYRNQTESGYTPELYTGKKEYEDLLFNDKLWASGFFGVKEVITVNAGTSMAEAFVIFMVNLEKIKSSNTDRKDEEARIDVERICGEELYGFTMTGWVTGIDSVFDQYSGWKKANGIKYRDMHPLHCFRINFNLLYSIDGVGC